MATLLIISTSYYWGRDDIDNILQWTFQMQFRQSKYIDFY